MWTYVLLNCVFLLAISTVWVIAKPRRQPVLFTLAILLLLTLVFDNVIIGIGMVDYDPSKLLGVYLGLAPVEDFGYAFAAAIGMPAIWKLVERKTNEHNS